MKFNRFITAILITVSFTGCASVVQVEKAERTKSQLRKGLYYSLPQTQLVVSIPLQQTIKSPSSLYKIQELYVREKYELDSTKSTAKTEKDEDKSKTIDLQKNNQTASNTDLEKQKPKPNDTSPKTLDKSLSKADILIGLYNAGYYGITEERIHFYSKNKPTTVIEPGITITRKAIPDDDNVFLVNLDESIMEDSDLTLELLENTVISSASTQSTNRALDFAVATIETGASITGKIVGLGIGGGTEGSRLSEGGVRKITSKELFETYLKRLKEINAEIVKMSDWINMRSGVPFEYYKTILAEYKKQELTYLNLILGQVSQENKWTLIFKVTPKKECLKRPKSVDPKSIRVNLDQADLYLSEEIKIPPCLANNAYLKPELTKHANVDLKNLKLVLKRPYNQPADKVYPLDESYDKGSFVYRVPANAIVEILDGKTLKYRTDLMIAQYGSLAQLPRDFQGKTAHVDLMVYTDTGAIKKAVLKSTAFQPSESVEAVGQAVGKVLDITERDRDLIRKRKLKDSLTLDKEIKALEEELGVNASN